MRHTACAAEDLSVHHHRAVAVVLRRKASFQRRRCQHRLEHRTDGIAFQPAIQEWAVRRVQTGGKVIRVIARHADAGPHGGRSCIQNQNAPAGHSLRCHRFRCALHLTRNGQLHPHSLAVLPEILRCFSGSQLSLSGDSAQQDVMFPRPGQQLVQCLFQSGSSMAFAIQISDQLLAQRCGRIPPGKRIARHSLPVKITLHP